MIDLSIFRSFTKIMMKGVRGLKYFKLFKVSLPFGGLEASIFINEEQYRLGYCRGPEKIFEDDGENFLVMTLMIFQIVHDTL